MSSPFDDPDFLAQFARHGIVHRPGLAKETLGDLGPLLAAEGIDLEDPDLDIDEVNAALARATERHNLELFTPVGAHRVGALAVLREFTVAIAKGDQDRARQILASIAPDPQGDIPAASHVIGVSFGFLDTRHSDPAYRRAVREARVPRWSSKPSMAASREIMALAAKGRAFDAMHSLHMKHSGFALFEGGALAVAASVIAQASYEGKDVADVAARVLTDAPLPAPPKDAPGAGGKPGAGGGSGAAFGRPSAAPPTDPFGRPVGNPVGKQSGITGNPIANLADRRAAIPARRQPTGPAPLIPRRSRHTDEAMVREFRTWLRAQPTIAAPSVADEIHMFKNLLVVAGAVDIDLRNPRHITSMLDEIFDGSWPEEAMDPALGTLDEYIHFRIATAADPEPWMDAHEEVEDALDDGEDDDDVPASSLLGEAMASSAEFSEEHRRQVLASIRIVAAVRELLEWIGPSRAVTASGGLRLADIEFTAGLLDISAVGVRKRPATDDLLPLDFDLSRPLPEPDTIHARSINDVPMLVTWWRTLEAVGLIELTATRVRPGSEAAAWLADPMPPLELADMLAGVFVSRAVAGADYPGPGMFETLLLAETMRLLLLALDPDADMPYDAPPLLLDLVAGHALGRIALLVRAGVVEVDADDELVVPPALRGPVARGLMLMITLERMEADGVIDDFFDEFDE